MSDNSVYNKGYGRVVFVEPNDINGKVGDVSITPDYTDYCISFRLTAEIVGRTSMNEYGSTDARKRDVTISWLTKKNDDGKTWVSFTDGSRIDNSDRRYLTTYYTDISSEDISENDIIEGLGVENINISFENFFVPTIKIRFIDVRGSAIFSREEVIHKDDKLTAENVFGCFFTVPYPKFRLQVKGFYGKAVTYQLYCSNFKGSFNASNGYYEADVTFIGYTYGILSDIPMAYIMASPYCKWCGSDYWDKNAKDNLFWRMSGIGNIVYPPPRLLDLADNIRNTVAGDRSYLETVLKSKESTALQRIIKKSDISDAVVSSYNDILENVKNINGVSSIEETSDSEDETEIVRENIINVSFLNMFDPDDSDANFNIEPASDTFSDGNKSYIENVLKKEFSNIDTTLFNRSVTEYNKTFSKSFDGIQDIYCDVNTVYDSEYSKEYKKYVYAITFSIEVPPVYYDALNTSKEYRSETDVIQVEVDNKNNSNAITIESFLKIYPYIGNVFRDVICHLETFMYMFKECVDEVNRQISDGKRTFDAMKIPLNATDIPDASKKTQIPAFPGIMVEETEDENAGDDVYEMPTTSMLKHVGWLGDFGDNTEMPEVKFVNSIFDALTTRNPDKKNNEKSDDKENDNRDMKVAIYTQLKNIYDRWLYSSTFTDYTVSKMMGDIVFIDSFFRDVSSVLHLNPEIVGRLLDSCMLNEGRILGFMDNIASQHHCMIFGFPDTFIFSNDGNGSGVSAMTNKLVEAFTPIPYSEMGDIEQMNKIVVVYTNKPSEIVNETNGYMGDYFDVYSDGDVFPSQLSESNSAYGYMIPSFGVSFGRQNNSIFKSVNISMENPIATEVSINATQKLATKTGSSRSKVQYYGQDIYRVFSGYSYFCEFEMMGCMQITPMMYFQLLNIPMFRGAYMIISVNHTITVGDMVTKVKGMRLSRNALPLTKKWFVPDKLSKIVFDEYGNVTNVGSLLDELTNDRGNVGDYSGSVYSVSDYVNVSADYDAIKNKGVDAKYQWLFDGVYGSKYNDKNVELIDMVRKTEPAVDNNGKTIYVLSDEARSKLTKYKADWMKYAQVKTYGENNGYKGIIGFTLHNKLIDPMKSIIRDIEEAGITNFKIDSSYRADTVGSAGKVVSNHTLGAAVDITVFRKFGNKNSCWYKDSNDNEWYPYLFVEGNPHYGLNSMKPRWKKLLADDGSLIHGQIIEQKLYDARYIRNEHHKVVQIFKNYGWGWGGVYGDTMHFSFFNGW